MAQFARENLSRRSWLLAGLTIPLFSARAAADLLNVSFDGDNLRLASPQFHFLTGRPLKRLQDGASVVYMSQITLSHEDNGPGFRHQPERLTISYDVWEEKFKVVMAGIGRSASGLSLPAAEAWCLDNLAISALGMQPTRPFWLRLDLRVATERELATLVGDPSGISIRTWIEFFSRKPGADQPHWTRSAGPLRLADLPRMARGTRG